MIEYIRVKRIIKTITYIIYVHNVRRMTYYSVHHAENESVYDLPIAFRVVMDHIKGLSPYLNLNIPEHNSDSLNSIKVTGKMLPHDRLVTLNDTGLSAGWIDFKCSSL